MCKCDSDVKNSVFQIGSLASVKAAKHGGVQRVPGIFHHPRPGLHLHVEEQALEAALDRHPPHRLLRRPQADLQLLHRLERGPSLNFGLNSPDREACLSKCDSLPTKRVQHCPQLRPDEDQEHQLEQRNQEGFGGRGQERSLERFLRRLQ